MLRDSLSCECPNKKKAIDQKHEDKQQARLGEIGLYTKQLYAF